MIYLSGLKEDERGLQVTYQHFKPELLGKTEAELLVNGVLVETLPTPIGGANKLAILYLDRVTKEPFYIYEDKPLTPEEELAKLKAEQVLMKKAMDDLIFNMGGAL